MSHFISLSTAEDMTELFRNQRENILKTAFQGNNLLPICETFDRDAFDILLAKTGCVSLRIYYGMSEDFKIHAIIVAADEEGADMLPTGNNLNEEDDDIFENGNRCPDLCPPTSPLNS
ncbi:MAG: hypothetical protein WDO71_22770 [Bacteroidota bacterium]